MSAFSVYFCTYVACYSIAHFYYNKSHLNLILTKLWIIEFYFQDDIWVKLKWMDNNNWSEGCLYIDLMALIYY